MLIQFLVTLITESGKHTIFLPQTQNDFDDTLRRIQILTGDEKEYKICHVTSNLDGVNKHIHDAKDVEELNFLAQLLEGFSDRECRTFNRFFNPRTMSVTMQNLINIAYSFYEFTYDYYDGRFFPAFDYEINYILKVNLSKYTDFKGVDIILPASDTVIQRALHRLGVSSIEECKIGRCTSWNLSALENIVAFGEEILELNELIKKLAKIPRYGLIPYLESPEQNNIITLNKLESFINSNSNIYSYMMEAMRV